MVGRGAGEYAGGGHTFRSRASLPRRPTRASCSTGLFHSAVLGAERANTKALIFHVKGEDLLFLDKRNARLSPEAQEDCTRLRLPSGPFDSVGLWAGARSDVAVPDTGRRQEGVTAYFWTVLEFVREGLLRFMFAEEGDERSQIADLVVRVEAQLQRHHEEIRDFPASVRLPDTDGNPVAIHSFDELCELIREHVEDDSPRPGAARSRPARHRHSCGGSTPRGFTSAI